MENHRALDVLGSDRPCVHFPEHSQNHHGVRIIEMLLSCKSKEESLMGPLQTSEPDTALGENGTQRALCSPVCQGLGGVWDPSGK